MPKKIKSMKNRKNKQKQESKRKLELADEEEQVYGFVEKALGNCYFNVKCSDGKTRRCKVRSRRLRIKLNNYLIISLRDFDDKNADIIHRYDDDEVNELKRLGKIETLLKNDINEDNNLNNFDIIFDDI